MRILRSFLMVGAAIATMASAATPKPIDLPGDQLHPESFSIAPDGTAYVGSMSGGVVRVSLKTGKAEQWIAPGAYGSGALFGVVADPRNKVVWTCTNDFSARGVTVAGSEPGSVLKGFDIKSGAGKISLKLPGEHPVCNDVAIAKDGSIYVANTGAPEILRWKPGAAALEVWATDPILGAAGLDGLAFGADGTLIVNNVRTGELFKVPMAADGSAGKVTKLTLSRPLVSPDGMRAAGGMDFVLAEGQGRVTKVTVKGDAAEVTTLAEGISEPTAVGLYGGYVWYSQGMLSYLFSPAKKGQTPPLPYHLTPVAWPK